MSSILPYLYTEREEYVSELGYEWIIRSQTLNATTEEITSRTFSALEFSTFGNLEFRLGVPPGYPERDVSGYYALTRLMTDNRYEAENIYAEDPEDPLYSANNFYGWRKTPVVYTHEAWYLDKEGLVVSWFPEEAGLGITIPTGNYIFTIGSGTKIQTTLVTPADQTSIVFSTGSYWGARVSRNGNIKAELVDSATATTGVSFKSQSPLLLDKTYIRLTRDNIPSSIVIGLYGSRWLGSLTFKTINESSWLYHSLDTNTNTRLKPPGLSHLNDEFDLREVPNKRIANRTESVTLL